jgi:hypothetical protein
MRYKAVCCLATALLCWVAACRAGVPPDLQSERRRDVLSIRVMLREGFDRDTVVLQVDGKEVKPDGPVTTRHDVEPPLAWSTDVSVDREVVSVRVMVPQKNLSQSIDLNVKKLPQLDVTMTGGKLILTGSPLVPSIG